MYGFRLRARLSFTDYSERYWLQWMLVLCCATQAHRGIVPPSQWWRTGQAVDQRDTVTDYSECMQADIVLFLRIAAIPFAIWSTDYSERLYLKPHSGQSRLLWLSSDVLLITVNVLLNTVNLCWENRRVVASATDNSECYVTRVMPLLMYKSRGPPAPGLSVIAYTLKVIVCLSRLGTGWRCNNAHSRLTTVNVCEVLPVSTDYSECRSLQSGFTDYSERRRTLILFTTDLLWPGIWRCLAFHLVPMLLWLTHI